VFEDFNQRVSEWSAWMSAPENRAALIKGGLAMMQPMQPGQNLAGHAASAMSQGLEAGGQVLETQQTRADANRKFDIQEKRLDKQDSRSDLAQERFFWQQNQAEQRASRQAALDERRAAREEAQEKERTAKRGTTYLKNYTEFAKTMLGDAADPEDLDLFMKNPANKARFDRRLEGDFSDPEPPKPDPTIAPKAGAKTSTAPAVPGKGLQPKSFQKSSRALPMPWEAPRPQLVKGDPEGDVPYISSGEELKQAVASGQIQVGQVIMTPMGRQRVKGVQ
jgi:hypothetical protein